MSSENGTVGRPSGDLGLRGTEQAEPAAVVRPSIPPGPMGGAAAAPGSGGGTEAAGTTATPLSLSLSAEWVDAQAIRHFAAHLSSLGLAVAEPATFFQRLRVLRRADGGVRVLLPEVER